MSKRLFIKRLLLALLLVYCISLVVHIAIYSEGYLWDVKVYYYAAKAHAAGLNPYDGRNLSLMAQAPTDLRFVYPPLMLWFFRPLSLVDYQTASYLFLAIKCILLAGLIYLWRNGLLDRQVDTLFYFFCLLAFNSALFLDFKAGNITVLLELLIWLGLYCFLRHKLLPFCLFVIAASVFKITPILFILLLAASKDPKKYTYMLCSVIVFSAIMLASYVAGPGLFADFVRSAGQMQESDIRNPATFPLVRDLLLLLSKYTGIAVPEYTSFYVIIPFYAVIAAVIFISWRAYVRINSTEMKDKEKIVVFLFCLVYALILPRFKDYSYILLLVPSYFIIKRVTYIKAYPFLFILAILSAQHVVLPGFNVVCLVLWSYYPLMLAYFVWGLYLHEIFTSKLPAVAETYAHNGHF
jgi:hypothetical protein